jgi:hypothetical protein
MVATETIRLLATLVTTRFMAKTEMTGSTVYQGMITLMAERALIFSTVAMATIYLLSVIVQLL